MAIPIHERVRVLFLPFTPIRKTKYLWVSNSSPSLHYYFAACHHPRNSYIYHIVDLCRRANNVSGCVERTERAGGI